MPMRRDRLLLSSLIYQINQPLNSNAANTDGIALALKKRGK
jgi:hypothetical protein